MKIKLYTCVTGECDYIGLNQIISCWEDSGHIERIHIPMKKDRRFISWVGRIGGLCLEPSNIESISDAYEYVLACQYRSKWLNMNRVLPWNFYVRNWKSYLKVMQELNSKTTKSIFSGTIRGSLHDRNKWINSTEVFSYRPARTYNRTNHLFNTIEDYYRGVSMSKFGLCPVGDCPICQRETEVMGLGCVPIFTPGVEWNYFEPLQENIHFVFAKDPLEMNEKINSMSESEIKEIANNGIDYFNRRCSPDGLWDSVLQTIEKFNIKL